MCLIDPGEPLRREDKLPESGSSSGEGGGSIQAEDGSRECRGRKEKEFGEEHLACERSSEGWEINGRVVENNSLEDQSREELSYSSRKESCESKDEDDLHVSRTSGNPLPSTHAAIGKETIECAELLEMNCPAAENLQTAELLDSTFKERSLDGIDLVGGGKDKPFKRKRNSEDMDFNASAIPACKDNCTSTAELSLHACEGVHSSERGVTCSKKQRYFVF